MIRFHQNHAAGLGEPRLAAAAFAINQLQQFIIQHFLSEKIGQSGDCLLNGADATHYVRTLLHELPELLVRFPHNLLHVGGASAGNGFHRTVLDLHTSSPKADGQVTVATDSIRRKRHRGSLILSLALVANFVDSNS
jgi:hypothetical protein